MATAYFIGGTPRAGKTTLLQKILERKPMRSLSTDALREVLQKVIDPNEQPDLFAASAFIGADIKTREDIRLRPAEVVAKQNRESAIVWRSVVPYVESVLSDGVDIVVEGVAVLPEFLAKSPFANCPSIFIGNRSQDHGSEILAAARQNGYDWLHRVPDDIIEAFSMFSLEFGKYLYAEAEKYKMAYVEMSETAFERSIERAVDALLAGDVHARGR